MCTIPVDSRRLVPLVHRPKRPNLFPAYPISEDIPGKCLGRYSDDVGVCVLPHRRRSCLCYCNEEYNGGSARLRPRNWSPEDSDFLSIPGELRNHVYRFALSSDYEDTGSRALLSFTQADVLQKKLSQMLEESYDSSVFAPKSHIGDPITTPETRAVLLEFAGLLRTRGCVREEVLRYIYDRLRLKLYLDSNTYTSLPTNILKNIRNISINLSILSQQIYPDFRTSLTPSLRTLTSILSTRRDVKTIVITCSWQPTNRSVTLKELVADYTIGVLGTMEQLSRLRAENGVDMRWMTNRFTVTWRPSEMFTMNDLVAEGYIDTELLETSERMVQLMKKGGNAMMAWEKMAWEKNEEVVRIEVIV